jgi:hypothetical protein
MGVTIVEEEIINHGIVIKKKYKMDLPISLLPAVTATTPSDLFATVNGGETRKVTLQQLLGLNTVSSKAQYRTAENTDQTFISSIGSFTKILTDGTTAGPLIVDFTIGDNIATYTGTTGKYFKSSVSLAARTTNEDVMIFALAVNGVVLDTSKVQTMNFFNEFISTFTHDVFYLNPGDYVEVWCTNNTSVSNVSVAALNVIIEEF